MMNVAQSNLKIIHRRHRIRWTETYHLIDRRSKCYTKCNAIIKCTSGEPDALAFIILVIMCDYQINKLTASLTDILQKNLSLHVALQRAT